VFLDIRPPSESDDESSDGGEYLPNEDDDDEEEDLSFMDVDGFASEADELGLDEVDLETYFTWDQDDNCTDLYESPDTDIEGLWSIISNSWR
jgi:hypothetical protein